MKVCGFTFIRNGIKYDYPFIEAIQSILPLCDEVIVAVGNCEDGTEEAILSLDNSKITILHTVWDDSLRQGGAVLAAETNKAFDAIPAIYDWCIYIQGDEVLPEESYEAVKNGMLLYQKDASIDGLLLSYRHFYGTYHYIADSAKWYRREVRIIKNDKSIRSYKDAQGFRKNGEKLRVKLLPAYIHHYGWVKSPKIMMDKQKSFNLLWHDASWVKDKFKDEEVFDYSAIDSLVLFKGTHPTVMNKRISDADWTLSINPAKKRLSLKNRFRKVFERLTGIRLFEYQNYKLM
jgi:hypothetical protein